MVDVEIRSFLNPEKYKDLIEKYNEILHTEKQITYYYDLNEDFRFMKTKRYSEICIKSGSMHDAARKEKVVRIDNQYTENMCSILNDLKYTPKVKWYRTRSRAKLEFGIEICLDYTIGYGYMIEVEKQIEEESQVDLTKIELGNFLESLDIDITSKEKFDKKYEEYILNWDRFTEGVDEEKFLK